MKTENVIVRKWSRDFKEGSRFQARTLINADPRDILDLSSLTFQNKIIKQNQNIVEFLWNRRIFNGIETEELQTLYSFY